MEGYCKGHKSDNWAEHHRGRNVTERGYGYAWRVIRKRVLLRDSYLCQACLKAGRLTPANQVDHIKPKAQGGSNDMGNLQSLCLGCHKAKTATDSA